MRHGSTVKSSVMGVNNSFLRTRKNLIFLSLAMVLSLLPLAGCSLLGVGAAEPTPDSGSEPGIPESPILFKDDFSSEQGGWSTTYPSSGSTVSYAHQGLEFYVNESEKDYWSIREGEYSNTGIGVDVSKLGGPDDNSFGVICRYQDAGNFYAFLVGSDGYYGIIKVKDGKYSLLSGNTMDYDARINKGRGTNRVLGICSQDELGLFVNGNLLTIVQDADLATGRIGLIAGTGAAPGADILFDNITIYQQ